MELLINSENFVRIANCTRDTPMQGVYIPKFCKICSFWVL